MAERNGQSKLNPARQPPDGQKAVPPRQTWLIFLLLLVANYFLVNLLFPGPDAPAAISYTLFRSELARDNVEAIHTRGETIEGKFKTAIDWTPPAEGAQAPRPEARKVENFTTILPAFVDPGLESELIERGVDIRATPIQTQSSPLLTLLSAFGPALLIIGIYVWLFRRAAKQGGGDPAANFKLRLAVQRAKAANMPNDNIDRAIAKATGSESGDQLDEIVYEGYGPGGTAILVSAMTDNRNRTVAEVRH